MSELEIDVRQYGRWSWTAILKSINGTGFLISPAYNACTRERAIAKATKDGKKIAGRWATKEKVVKQV